MFLVQLVNQIVTTIFPIALNVPIPLIAQNVKQITSCPLITVCAFLNIIIAIHKIHVFYIYFLYIFIMFFLNL